MANSEVRLRVLAFIKDMIPPIVSQWESCDEMDKTVRFGKEMKGAIRAFDRIIEQHPNQREYAFLMLLLKKADFFSQQTGPYLIDKYASIFDWQLVSLTIDLKCKATVDLFLKHGERVDWHIITYRLLVDRNPLAMFFMARFASNLIKEIITKVAECLKLGMGNNRYIDELYDLVEKNADAVLDGKTIDWIKICVKMLSKTKRRDLYYALDYPVETTVNRKYYMNIDGVMRFFFAAYKEQHPRFILLKRGFPLEMDNVEEVITKGHEDLPYMYWSFPQELRYAFENSYFTPKVYRMKSIPTHPEGKPKKLKIVTEDQGDGTCNIMIVDTDDDDDDKVFTSTDMSTPTGTTMSAPIDTTVPMGKCELVTCSIGEFEFPACIVDGLRMGLGDNRVDDEDDSEDDEDDE